MKLKQAKAISWKQANEGVIGENGVLANGLRVRSDIKAGDPAGYCVNGTTVRWTETETNDPKMVSRTRECKACERFMVTSGTMARSGETCGDWSEWL